jgi:hypothetical protein
MTRTVEECGEAPASLTSKRGPRCSATDEPLETSGSFRGGWRKRAAAMASVCRPNGSIANLRGQGPHAEALVARRLPRILLDSNA